VADGAQERLELLQQRLGQWPARWQDVADDVVIGIRASGRGWSTHGHGQRGSALRSACGLPRVPVMTSRVSPSVAGPARHSGGIGDNDRDLHVRRH
jgi:hypothetical protein